MYEEAKEMAVDLAIKYSEIEPNMNLISLASQMYNYFKATGVVQTTDATKYKALSSAIHYCQIQPNEDLFAVAEKIYQFVVKEE